MRQFILPGILVPLVAISFAALTGSAAPLADDPRPKQVDAIVARLASTLLHQAEQGWGLDSASHRILVHHARGETAILELQKSGPKIYPYLIKYKSDGRYSYSTTVSINGPPEPTWYDMTVGGVVMDILSRDCGGGGYMQRDSPAGKVSPPYFGNYIQEIGPDQWAHWARDKTRLVIGLAFIDWARKKEEKAGFTDDKQRHWIEDDFDKRREELKAKYRNEAPGD